MAPEESLRADTVAAPLQDHACQGQGTELNEADLAASSESKGLIRPCREEVKVWPALMTLLTCPVYGSEVGVLGQRGSKPRGQRQRGESGL